MGEVSGTLRLGCFGKRENEMQAEMQLIPNQYILYGQEVKPVSDPSPLRIKVSVPC